jgi:hypothetical protein
MHIVKIRPALTLLWVLAVGIATSGRAAAQGPPAPTPIAPANGASVTVPFTISWSAVSDPSGLLGYNWQVSSSSTFTSVALQNSTNGLTQDTVSGLPNGVYFWRVDAVSGAFVTGAWSAAQSFNVTGAAGEPGAPTLAPTQAYSTFHPFESITFNWTAVPGAASYVLQAATDPSFPILTRIQFDNIPNTTMTFEIGNPEGAYSARVYAVDASGIAGVPSNVINFSVFFNNPIGPPPALVSPPTGTVATLPVTLTWADVPNPQPSGYELQIARDSGFSSIEENDPQLNGPSRTVLSLTSGTKFWRVRSAQGDSSPTTAAETAWSAARSFTIPSTPPTPVSVTVVSNPLYSGDTTWIAVQLTSAAPATGSTITLSSSNATAAPVPSTIAMQGNLAWTQFQVTTGQVTSPTVVTLTATLNSGSASVQFTLLPPSLKSLIVTPATISGGAQPTVIAMLNGQAPAGGAVVSLSSNSPAVQPPAFANVAPGNSSVSLAVTTSTVTANTAATLTATWNGVSTQSQVTLTPQQPPTALTLSPASTVGQNGGSFATVSIASPAPTDDILQVTVDNPSVATVNNSVVIPAGNTRGGFNIFTTAVTTTTVVTISVSGGGVTQSATLTVTPVAPPPATLSAIVLSPSTVVGGNSSQGTATLASAAPSGGAVVTLTSSNTARATVPASVTVAAGATSATFTVSTASETASTSATISGVSGGVSRSALLTISKTPAPASLSSLTVSPATVAGGNNSQGTVTLSSAAPSGGAIVTLTSGNTAAATAPASVTVAAGATKATFTVSTVPVAASTSATISGAFGGASRSAVLTVTPPPPPASLSSVAVSPASVTGGAASQGTVTLTGAAPSGGFTATLASNDPAAAVPASVTVAQGATSATFAIATSSVITSTPVTITASAGAVTRTATLTVTPPGQTATLTVTATGRSGERVTSSPAGINVAVGSTMPAPFTTGTAITLTVSNGRNAAWSGACTSGGSKTCTFTLAGNASVTANVQ